MDSGTKTPKERNTLAKASSLLSKPIAMWLAIFSENTRQPVGRMVPEIWLRMFGPELTVEQFEAACKVHLRRSRFFPTVADILEVAEEQRNEPRLCDTPTAQKLFAIYKKKNAEEEARRAGKDGPVQDAIGNGKR